MHSEEEGREKAETLNGGLCLRRTYRGGTGSRPRTGKPSFQADGGSADLAVLGPLLKHLAQASALQLTFPPLARWCYGSCSLTPLPMVVSMFLSAGPIVPLPQECLPRETTQTAETLSRWMLKPAAKWKQRTPSPEDISPASRHTHTLQFQPVASQSKRCDKPVKIQ
ncbi:hypothetical protein CapIbe_012820 [Capra ibex]